LLAPNDFPLPSVELLRQVRVGLSCVYYGFASVICFILFLKQLNFYIGAMDRVANASQLVVLMIVWVIGAISVFGLIVFAMQLNPNAMRSTIAMGVLCLLAASLVVFLNYTNLVHYTGKSIGEPRVEDRKPG